MVTEFVNLAHAENQQQYAAVIGAVKQHNLPLPLVAIDGEVRMAGGVDYYAITEAIDAATAPASAS